LLTKELALSFFRKVFANALARFLFSKGGAVEAAEVSSPSAEGQFAYSNGRRNASPTRDSFVFMIDGKTVKSVCFIKQRTRTISKINEQSKKLRVGEAFRLPQLTDEFELFYELLFFKQGFLQL